MRKRKGEDLEGENKGDNVAELRRDQRAELANKIVSRLQKVGYSFKISKQKKN